MTSSSAGEGGRPAMRPPRRPRACTSRDTSAALVVRYLRAAPETGSYVFRVREPRGGFGAAVSGGAVLVLVVVGSVVVAGLGFRCFGLLMLYFVVMRVYWATGGG